MRREGKSSIFIILYDIHDYDKLQGVAWEGGGNRQAEGGGSNFHLIHLH